MIYTKAQRDLVVEYRTMHPEFSDLSDAEIALMNPVSPEVFNLYASNALLSIDNELQDIYEEKKENKRLFKTNYHDSDINNDIDEDKPNSLADAQPVVPVLRLVHPRRGCGQHASRQL